MIYLDNGATTYPKPKSVIKSVVEAVEIYGGNPGRSGHFISMRTSEKIHTVRESVANFFGASCENVIFTQNCTIALNMAIKGVMKNSGHIITSCMEHNSVSRPIYKMAQEGRVRYSVAKIYKEDKMKTLESFAALIKADTKAIVCMHASNVDGYIFPIKEIGKMCRESGIKFIVDAAQTAGILPIEMQSMNIDVLCTAGHKGLFGVTGSGLMILGDGVEIDSFYEGGTGSASSELAQPNLLPDKFESGTVNTVGIISLGAGIEHIKKIGLEQIYKYEMSLCAYLYQRFRDCPNIITYCDDFSEGKYVPIVLFNIRGVNSVEVVERLNQKGYAVRGGLHCSPYAHEFLGTGESGAVRVSPQSANNKHQIIALANEVASLAEKFGTKA